MSDSDSPEDAPKKPSKLPIILGLVLLLAGGGGGFFAIYSGLLFGGASPDQAESGDDTPPPPGDMPDVAFVAVDPLLIGLGGAGTGQHLRFRVQLEVASGSQADVERLLPRVMDVMNTYLRAIELTDLQDPAALMRLRAQLLRRVQVVAGPGRVRDLLVMEFVVS